MTRHEIRAVNGVAKRLVVREMARRSNKVTPKYCLDGQQVKFAMPASTSLWAESSRSQDAIDSESRLASAEAGVDEFSHGSRANGTVPFVNHKPD